MVCVGLETLGSTSIVGILAYPNTCFYWFWGAIMLAFWLVLALTLYFTDKDNFQKSDFMSALGVSSIVNIFAGFGLTLLREELPSGVIISVLQQDVFITLFVINIVSIVFWILKKE